MALDLSKYGEPVKPTGGLDLSKYGTPLTMPEETVKPDGFFKSFYKSMASPVFNILARPAQAVQSLVTGQQPATGKFLGVDINAPKTGGDVLRDVGRGLETIALGIGGGGSANILKTGIKEGVKAGVKEGAMVGLKSSPLFGAGASLEAGNQDIGTILKDAATATAIGVPVTATLGGIIPGVSGVAKKFTQQGVRDELGSIYRQTAAKYVKPQAVIDQSELVNKTDPVSVLQMYGKNVIPEMKGGGASTEEGQAFIKAKIGELSNLRNEELFLNDTRIPLAGYRKYAEELADGQNWSESKKIKVKEDLAKIFDELDSAYEKSPKNVNGIELTELNTIKTEQTGLSKSYNNKAPRFDYDAHGIAGKAARDLIELTTESETTKDLNKLIQSHYDAIDLLDALNGKKVHGGAMSKMFFKLGGDIVGAAAGSSVGNPILGAATGHVIAGKVADVVQSKFITNPVKRLLINNLKEQSPKEVQAALKSLETKYKDVFDDLFPDGVNYSLENNQRTVSPITAPANTANTKAIPESIPSKSKPVNTQGGFVSTGYKETGDLTTKILKKLEGRETVSKQFISDLTNSGDLKQVERDVIRGALEGEKDVVNVKQFADKVKQELLPLKVKDIALSQKQSIAKLKEAGYEIDRDMSGDVNIINKKGDIVEYDDLPVETQKLIDSSLGNAQSYSELGRPKYENIALPSELRGSVKNYKENIYESPIKTSAGSSHFSGQTDNYFGHTRIEDMADNKTRRVIEVQSDLYQKGNLEREFAPSLPSDYDKMSPRDYKLLLEKGEGALLAKNKKYNKLAQYNDPTAHFRMIREELAQAAKDGKTKLQFPTGETAMKIEGLGQQENNWRLLYDDIETPAGMRPSGHTRLTTQNLDVGQRISGNPNAPESQQWIITDVLGDGKFKAIPRETLDAELAMNNVNLKNVEEKLSYARNHYKDVMDTNSEQFDISGKVDTSNPIYKFYNKDVANYLKRYNGKQVIDDKGVSWIEVPVTKDMKGPVEAFGMTQPNILMKGALAGGALVGGANLLGNMKTSTPATMESSAPVKESKPIEIRGETVRNEEIQRAIPIIFAEVSNRSKDKQELEVKVILNTALNRMREYARYGMPKTLIEVLTMPNQYQGYDTSSSTSQYNLAVQNKLDKLSKTKLDTVSSIITDVIKKGLTDNTFGSFYYIHKPDGTIVVQPEKKLFAE